MEMDMTSVDIAERKSRLRAFGFLFLAALTCAVMALVRTRPDIDFTQGLWLGLLVGCALNLLPLKRLINPRSAVAQLLDDEGAREHRRTSCTIGFWAAVLCAVLLGFISHFDPAIGAGEVGQLVATAAVVSAMISFALLELRAAR
jgi:multisubunit Na+/H+ antiporter MnhB subunit